jgi:hypothetical protein
VSESERYEIAKAHVDQQLKKMKTSGLKVKKVTTRQYETMVRQVASAVRA